MPRREYSSCSASTACAMRCSRTITSAPRAGLLLRYEAPAARLRDVPRPLHGAPWRQPRRRQRRRLPRRAWGRALGGRLPHARGVLSRDRARHDRHDATDFTCAMIERLLRADGFNPEAVAIVEAGLRTGRGRAEKPPNPLQLPERFYPGLTARTSAPTPPRSRGWPTWRPRSRVSARRRSPPTQAVATASTVCQATSEAALGASTGCSAWACAQTSTAPHVRAPPRRSSGSRERPVRASFTLPRPSREPTCSRTAAHTTRGFGPTSASWCPTAVSCASVRRRVRGRRARCWCLMTPSSTRCSTAASAPASC